VLPVLLLGCALPPIEPEGSVVLPGGPSGMVLDATGRPVVVHADADGQCCRLTAFEPTLASVLHERGAGPGVPRAVEDRTWFALRTGITALDPGSVDGADVLWTAIFEAPVVAVGPAAALSDGTLVVAGNDALEDLPTNGRNARLVEVDRFGGIGWSRVLGGAFVGGLRVAPDDTVYATTRVEGGPETLYAVAVDGTVRWSIPGGGTPLIPLDEGLLVARGGLVARVDAFGEDVWVSTARIEPTGVDARAEVAATLTASGQLWVTAPGEVAVLDVDTGTTVSTLNATCGPLVVGQDVALWGFCTLPTSDRIALTRLTAFDVQARGLPVAGQAVGPPVLTGLSDGGTATAYALYSGSAASPEPRLVRYPGAANLDEAAPWAQPAGAKNTGATSAR
jgi:hypothetical protein